MYKKKQKVDKNTINFEKIMFHYNIYNEHVLTSYVAIKFNLYCYQMRSAKKVANYGLSYPKSSKDTFYENN